MPSRNTYRLTGVSLTLDVGCLFISSKAHPPLLTLDEGYLLMATPPDLEHGVAPLGPPPRSRCPLDLALLLSATAPDLGREVAPLC